MLVLVLALVLASLVKTNALRLLFLSCTVIWAIFSLNLLYGYAPQGLDMKTTLSRIVFEVHPSLTKS